MPCRLLPSPVVSQAPNLGSWIWDMFQDTPYTAAQDAARCRNLCLTYLAGNGRPCLSYMLTKARRCYLFDIVLAYKPRQTDRSLQTSCTV